MSKPKSICNIDGCERLVNGRGLCSLHYNRAKKAGEFQVGVCFTPGCSEATHGHNLCVKHYNDALEAGKFGGIPCKIDGCTKTATRQGHCAAHYAKARNTGGLGAKNCAVPACKGFVVGYGRCRLHYNRARKYGLSNEELAIFDGAPCQICGDVATDIDHCHDSGTVRGYLCRFCNLGLGNMRDRPDFLRAAANYLEQKDV